MAVGLAPSASSSDGELLRGHYSGVIAAACSLTERTVHTYSRTLLGRASDVFCMCGPGRYRTLWSGRWVAVSRRCSLSTSSSIAVVLPAKESQAVLEVLGGSTVTDVARRYGVVRRCGSGVRDYFSRLMPLNVPPDFLADVKCPVFESRFVQSPVFGFRICERSDTAPLRYPLPVFLAIRHLQHRLTKQAFQGRTPTSLH